MSNYTTELRYICETLAGFDHSQPAGMVDEIIDASYQKIFDFAYPAYTGLDTGRLEKSIILAYYTREIGSETYGLFKLRLKQKMRRIMPYFNQLYESADIKYNPLHNVDYKDEFSGSKTGDRENTNVKTETIDDTNSITKGGENKYSTNTSATRKYADTPQGGLTGLKADEYLTEAEMNDQDNFSTEEFGETTTNQRNAGNTNKEDLSMQEKFVDENNRRIYGKIGGESMASMIKEYRETILNIDEMVIEELGSLFFGLW